MDARTISQAAKNVIAMAPLAEVMITVRLFMIERMIPLSANAVT